MNTQNVNDNIAVVRRLYEARGDPDIIPQVLAPDVRWEVVEGFPYSDVYLGLNGVSDFFTRLFSDFEDWRTEPSEFLKRAITSSLLAHIRQRRKPPAKPSRRVSLTSGQCATA